MEMGALLAPEIQSGSLVVSNWEHVIISVQAGTFTNKCHLTNWTAGCQEVPLKVNQMVSSWLEWI